MSEKTAEQYSDAEAARLYRETLAKVLAAPPDHKTKAKPGASPKKRGRPARKNPDPELMVDRFPALLSTLFVDAG